MGIVLYEIGERGKMECRGFAGSGWEGDRGGGGKRGKELEGGRSEGARSAERHLRRERARERATVYALGRWASVLGN